MQKLKPWLRFIEGDEGGQSTDGAGDETGAEGTDGGDTEGDQDVDWKAKFEAEREHSRKWEQRAKANKDATDKLKQIEEAGKPDDQKVADELAEAQRIATEAQVEVRRYRMAAKYGLSDEQADLYLTDPDEDRMEKQAQGLSELGKKTKRTGGETHRDRTPPAPTLKTGAELYDRVKNKL